MGTDWNRDFGRYRAAFGRGLRATAQRESSQHIAELFRRAVYGWHILSWLMLFPIHNRLFNESFENLRGMELEEKWTLWELDHLVFHELVSGREEYFYYMLLPALLLCFFGKGAVVVGALACILTANVNSWIWLTLDGGSNLMSILLAFAVFVRPIQFKKTEVWNSERSPISGLFDFAKELLEPFRNSVSNAFLLVARFQIAFVYIFAGLAKVQGEMWQNGTALYYILQNQVYSDAWFTPILLQFPKTLSLMTHLVIAFQISFPFLIFNRATKWIAIGGGIVFHLGIIFTMGLTTFGLAMVFSYVAFLEEKECKAILCWASKMKQMLNPRKMRSQKTIFQSKEVLS